MLANIVVLVVLLLDGRTPMDGGILLYMSQICRQCHSRCPYYTYVEILLFRDNARIISAGMYVEVMNRAAASKFSSHDRSDESVVKMVYVKEGGKFVRSVSKLCRHLC